MTAQPLAGQQVIAETLPNGSRRSTQIGDRLGGGGEGGVYRDLTRQHFALKIMHTPDVRTENKVRGMLAQPPGLQVEGDSVGNEIVQIAWPQEILYDSLGQFCGYSMRLLDKTKTVPFNAWFDHRARARNRLLQSDLIRVYLAANLASVTKHINGAGHAVVDFKPQNVQAYREHGYVCLIDCDGFLIRSGQDIFPAAGATPAYLAPEYHHNFDATQLDERQDRFALAVMIFTLLDNGIHPASGSADHLPNDLAAKLARGAIFLDPASGLIPPSNSHFQFLPDNTLAMFRRAFVGRPDQRPTSSEWSDHLRNLAPNMIRCSANRDHWHYGKGCPWCTKQQSPTITNIQIAVPAQATLPSASPSNPPSSTKPAAGVRVTISQGLPVLLVLVIGVVAFFYVTRTPTITIAFSNGSCSPLDVYADDKKVMSALAVGDRGQFETVSGEYSVRYCKAGTEICWELQNKSWMKSSSRDIFNRSGCWPPEPMIPGSWMQVAGVEREQLVNRFQQEASEKYRSLGTEFGRVRKLSLPFYDQANLFEAEINRSGQKPMVVPFVVGSGKGNTLSDLGEAESLASWIKALNNQHSLRLSNEGEVIAYAVFSFPLILLQVAEDIAWNEDVDIQVIEETKKAIPPVATKNIGENSWLVKGVAQIDDELYLGNALIESNGKFTLKGNYKRVGKVSWRSMKLTKDGLAWFKR